MRDSVLSVVFHRVEVHQRFTQVKEECYGADGQKKAAAASETDGMKLQTASTTGKTKCSC